MNEVVMPEGGIGGDGNMSIPPLCGSVRLPKARGGLSGQGGIWSFTFGLGVSDDLSFRPNFNL